MRSDDADHPTPIEAQLLARIIALENELAAVRRDLTTERMIHAEAINRFMRPCPKCGATS